MVRRGLEFSHTPEPPIEKAGVVERFQKEEKAMGTNITNAERYFQTDSDQEKEKIIRSFADSMGFISDLLVTLPDQVLKKIPIQKVNNFLTVLDEAHHLNQLEGRHGAYGEPDFEIGIYELSTQHESPLVFYRVDGILEKFSEVSEEDFTQDEMKDHLAKTPAENITVFDRQNTYHFLDEFIEERGREGFDELDEAEIVRLWQECREEGYFEPIFSPLRDAKLRSTFDQPELRDRIEAPDGAIVSRVAKNFVGVFDERGILKKVQEQGQDHLMDLQEAKLFATRPGMSAEQVEEKRQVVRDVESVMDLRVRALIEQDFGFSMSGLTLREQVWFMGTLRDASGKDLEKIEMVTKKFGIDGARAFLSVEFGDEFQGVVIGISERFAEEQVKEIFKRFAEIAELAQTQVDALRKEFFAEGKEVSIEFEALEENLLSRAKQLLTDASEKNPDKLFASLRKYNKDVVLFTTMFRTIFKGQEEVNFSELRGLEFGSVLPQDVSAEDQKEMYEIFDENWSDQDAIAAKKFRGDLQRGLDPHNKNTHFYVLKKDGNVSAFIRFDHRDDLEPGAYYAGSLNISPELRSSAIGRVFMENTLDKEAEKHTLYAHVVPDAEVGTRYVEDGLVITGVDEVTVDNLKTVELAIRKDERKNPSYRARQEGVTNEKLLKGVEGVRVERFDYTEEKDAFLDTIRTANKRGEVVTRYWVDPENKDVRYLAIEPDVELDTSRIAA